jgi:toxin-antitoxin system PIN domain toxin
VKIIDLNILLYAVNRDAPMHGRACAWLEGALSGEEQIGIPWVVLLGFLRLTTRHGLLPRPLDFEQASALIDEWLAQPGCVVVHPGDRHWEILKTLLSQAGAAGNLTTDAHLAAIAMEHDATLCSTDRDFQRFAGLDTLNPLG